MKIANIVTSAVLAAAVVVLFILHFSGGEKGEKRGGDTREVSIMDPSGISIAFFSMDSVMNNWDLYFSYQQELSKKQSEMEAEFAGKTESFYQRVQDAQYKIQRQLVTRSEAEQLQQQLASEEQQLMGLQNQYAADLQEQGMVKNRQMMDMIERYVTKLSKENGYSFVYSYQFGGNLIYGAKPYDITSQVVAGLNQTYITGTETD
ncbi:MAG: OmpH family outer membrane protein [Bacteroidales bacterium]